MLGRRAIAREEDFIKALLFDIDGVLLYHPKWFVEEIAEKLPAGAFQILYSFHEGPINIQCDKGLKDPLVEIKPFLREAGWTGNVDDYFAAQYKFEKHGIDFELLNIIKIINDRKTKCFIGSNQNWHRKAFLINEMKLNEIFEETYFSCDLGYAKPEKEYWENAFSKMNKRLCDLKKSDVVFFDDRKENIESAAQYGFKAIQINNREEINKVLVGILS